MTTILVYEGDDEQRSEVRDLLESRGDEWHTVEAEDRTAALDTVAKRPVDLVVAGRESCDFEDFLPTLRSKHVRIPVLVLSNDDVDRVDALVMGAASYVPRSTMARDLVVVAKRLLTLAGCRRRHARLLDGLLANEVKFRITGNDRSMIPVLCGYLVDGLDEFALVGDANRMQICVALEEAMVNGIVHGNLEVPSILREQDWPSFERTIEERRELTSYSHRVLTVRANFTADVAAIEIRDQGPGFDPDSVPDPTDPRYIDRPHGRGLYLIRSFVDDVRFNDTGNAITLIVRKRETADEPGSETDSTETVSTATIPGESCDETC